MSLKAGTRLGPYEVTAPIGAGGMGEVYRATDTKLRRDVAIKVLPEAFTSDPDRLARFEREAKVLASLNHPNIGGIHGLEESEGVKALVLELVEGPTLADRISQGPIPLDEALPIARQIAEALEAAHEQGIIHRDLKPANVKVKTDGTVKVLDFGLAKAFQPEATDPDQSQSPTLTGGATQMGVILGTAAYMAPEQARGRPVDKRADVWAFGVVLYEMLAGHRLFACTDVADTLALVLTKEIDWTVLPKHVPRSVRQLLQRCLERDARQRLRDMGEARISLRRMGTLPGADHVDPEAITPGVNRRLTLAWSITAVMGVVAAVTIWMTNTPPAPAPSAVTRFAVNLPADRKLNVGLDHPIALSPDGTRLVYTVRGDRDTMLYVRRFDQFDAAAIPGTEGARYPFFSPDNKWVGFFAAGKIKKVALAGGEPQPICDAPPFPLGAAWGPDDTIVFAPEIGGGLRTVPASGGPTEPLTRLDVENGETAHGSPQVLPNGGAVLFTIRAGSRTQVGVKSLENGEQRTLDELGSAGGAWYVPTGHLVFARGSGLWAAAFDPDRLEVLGSPFFVSGKVYSRGLGGLSPGIFTLSSRGSLAYVPSGGDDTLGWVDREGRFTAVQAGGRLHLPRLSPDNSRVALSVDSEESLDVWLLDLHRGGFNPLAVEGTNLEAAWTPDGTRVTFTSNRSGGQWNLYEMAVDGSGKTDLLYAAENVQFPGSWSPDGRVLAFYERNSTGTKDIWLLPRDGDPVAIVSTPASEHSPRFSPDGRWLAYVSNASGREEVHVSEIEGSGDPWRVSQEGGSEPVWSADGRELFYRNGDQMMRVAVETEPTFIPSTPEPLFVGDYRRSPNIGGFNYDVSSDGQRFLMVREDPVIRVHVILNWIGELERLAGVD